MSDVITLFPIDKFIFDFIDLSCSVIFSFTDILNSPVTFSCQIIISSCSGVWLLFEYENSSVWLFSSSVIFIHMLGYFDSYVRLFLYACLFTYIRIFPFCLFSYFQLFRYFLLFNHFKFLSSLAIFRFSVIFSCSLFLFFSCLVISNRRRRSTKRQPASGKRSASSPSPSDGAWERLQVNFLFMVHVLQLHVYFEETGINC